MRIDFICGEILNYATKNVSNICFVNTTDSFSSTFANPRKELVFLLIVGYAIYQALITSQTNLQELLLDPSKFTPTELANPIEPTPHDTYLQKVKYKGDIPKELVCPISLSLMYDPVRISGKDMSKLHVFERRHLEVWLATVKTDEDDKPVPKTNPLTGLPLPSDAILIPADDVKKKIDEWLHHLLLLRSAFLLWSKPRTGSARSAHPSEQTGETPTI